MKKYIKYLQNPIVGFVVSVLIGLSVANYISLSASVTPDFTPCNTQPCFNGTIDAGKNISLSGIPTNLSVTQLILRAINFILSVILVIAVLAIIIAGVYLITGMGSDTSKDRAKNIIMYVVIGILVILFSRAIVVFFLGLFR